MSAPRTIELEVVDAQMARLRAITGGADWHTAIGQQVHWRPLAEQDPPRHVALISVEMEPADRFSARIAVEWQAVVPVTDQAGIEGLLALADLRAALVCDHPETRIESAQVALRDQGSNVVVISITAGQLISLG
jgi:hypothetical protein